MVYSLNEGNRCSQRLPHPTTHVRNHFRWLLLEHQISMGQVWFMLRWGLICGRVSLRCPCPFLFSRWRDIRYRVNCLLYFSDACETSKCASSVLVPTSTPQLPPFCHHLCPLGVERPWSGIRQPKVQAYVHVRARSSARRGRRGRGRRKRVGTGVALPERPGGANDRRCSEGRPSLREHQAAHDMDNLGEWSVARRSHFVSFSMDHAGSKGGRSTSWEPGGRIAIGVVCKGNLCCG